MRRLMVLATLVLLATFSVAQDAAPNWQPWRWLIGDWVGEGSGSPGGGAGEFSLSPDLQNRVLVRKSFAAYPATKDRPAFRHDDLMIIYQETSTATRAEYFDNEGHVIRYTATISPDGNSIVLVSESAPKQPAYRLTYTATGKDTLKLSFEIAPPDHPTEFRMYLQASAHRKH